MSAIAMYLPLIIGVLLGLVLLLPVGILHMHFGGMPTVMRIDIDITLFGLLMLAGAAYHHGAAGHVLFTAAWVLIAPCLYTKACLFMERTLMKWETEVMTALCLECASKSGWDAPRNSETLRVRVERLQEMVSIPQFFLGYTLGRLARHGVLTVRKIGDEWFVELTGVASATVWSARTSVVRNVGDVQP